MKFTMNSPDRMLNDRNRVRAQAFMGSEVCRLMAPKTPMKSGALRSAAVPVDGGKQVVQATPYARRQYYGNYRHAVGGPQWFEQMKASGGMRTILQGVARIMGGKAE